MGMSWTTEQRQVIELRDKNILVSAAAGSGKTAVLVERIITRLTKDEPPVDVDRLLIVTYTDAAAAEMKERIAAAVQKALEANPSDTHLKKQATLIHTAKITTIHSFCLSVIREYFHTIDLDPGFRIAEEGELKLLKQDVMREMLEGRYEEAEEDFLRFVETFATGREDTRLEEIIDRLYEFAGSYPDPEAWLDACVHSYEAGSLEEDTPFMKMILTYMFNCLADIKENIEMAKQICLESDGPYVYEKTLEADEKLMEPLWGASGYKEFYKVFSKMGPWARLAANRDKTVNEEKTAQVKALRESWKNLIGDLKETYFFQTPDEMEKDMELCLPIMKMLVNLVKEFQTAFAQKKEEKNLIDFRDMEQFALKILTRKEEGELVPSEVAQEYQDLFEEVMIDEYQDSNLIQEAILTSVSRVSRGENNLFMVGDVKQSIYRFRLSRPELFMEKFDTYSTTDEGNCRRIDLHKNFRSRGEVLDVANAIFRQIMTKKLGKIEYDDNAALYVGAQYPVRPDNETEVIIVDTDTREEEIGETSRELEARAAAERIHALMESQKVWDKELEDFRPVEYRDIVILTRSLAGWTDVFTRVLNREGIPAYAGSKEGYFGTLEIGWMLDYLRVLDNFRQDLPMAAVLKSPFGGCTNEELAVVRKTYPDLAFCEAVIRASGESEETGISGSIREKLGKIFERMNSFRERVPYTSIHDLLWEIMKETGYRDYVAAMPGGEQRMANLDMLLARAKAFEATSYKGLFHFVRYIVQLQKYDVDFGEAGIYDEQTNAVRLMSIHKSKGLEFPVVIVAGMGKRFNMQDIRNGVVIHPELGLGIDAVDIIRRTKCPTLLKKAIQMETSLENLGEELRVLYVALTRAKEKLILLGSINGAEKKMAEYGNTKMTCKGTLAFTRLIGARMYYDWVLPAIENLLDEVKVETKVLKAADIVQEEMLREAADTLEKDVFLRSVEDAESPFTKTDEKFAARLEEQFGFQYPFAGEEQLKLKYTVSELKKRAALADEAEETGEMLIKEEEVIPLVPQFLQKKEQLTGASRGSAYHKLLELLDFSREYDRAALEGAVAEFVQNGMISAEMAECIRVSDMMHFLQTDPGRRMCLAAHTGNLYKEQPFVFGVDAKEVYTETDCGEMVLIQGIIDVYFEEEDGLVVLDYKTDQVRCGQELIEKYQEQLQLYGRALEQMTLKKVKEKIIYSFALGEEIILPDSDAEKKGERFGSISGYC